MDAHENGGLPKLQIVAVMSVPPLKVTEPRRIHQVLVNDPTFHTSTIVGCYQICLYYEKSKEEEHRGWHNLAGWIVESLGKALLEYPLLAGRLKRRKVGDDFEIVSNDSGIRLLEAIYPISLSEFLVLNEKEHLEAELVFWKEIDHQCPDFSPLFYVQVTNFECGGYSIGISCSLLLADVLVVENFLKKWAQIHNNMLPQNEEIKTPIFFHPRTKNPDPLPSDIISRTLTKNGMESLVFKIFAEDVDFNKELLWRELAMLCVEDAEKISHIKMGSEFSLLVKESLDLIKVENCSKGGYSMLGLRLKDKITRVTWNDFGVYEVAFHEGNKPVHVSCWVGSVADGNVMAFPCMKENGSAVIIVSAPLELLL